MSKKRRNHSAAFKAKVALDALKGDKTLRAFAYQYSLHPNQIQQCLPVVTTVQTGKKETFLYYTIKSKQIKNQED